MPPTTSMQVLDVDECLRLLDRHPTRLGRVGFCTIDAGVVILPVNYRVWRGSVVFCTNPGSKLWAARDGARLAVEVDDVDVAWQDGWSVLVKGVGREVVDPDELDGIRALGLSAWAGATAHVVEVMPTAISGRRIT